LGTALFQNYPKFHKNEGFQLNINLSLKTTKKRWPRANKGSEVNAFGQKIPPWPKPTNKPNKKASRPRFGHFF